MKDRTDKDNPMNKRWRDFCKIDINKTQVRFNLKFPVACHRDEFWSDGYYVGTVGDGGNWSVGEKYVKEQGKPIEELKQLSLF